MFAIKGILFLNLSELALEVYIKGTGFIPALMGELSNGVKEF
ncbi:MAG: hypothetical protein AABZ11_01450 [Nitrospinota bacterium]